MRWEVAAVYGLIIGLEICLSNYQHKKVYTWKETWATIVLSGCNGLLDLAVRGMYLLVLTWIFRYSAGSIQNPVFYWGTLFLLLDFQFYWLHRLEHYCRLFWAAHVTHHSAEHMNLTVGFRASLMRPLYDFLFFLPLAFLGFRPIDILLMYSIAQIWAVFLHTEMIGRLGWLEHVFVTPSHHRVHHASNTLYLDKNMGMVLILWDRLFGTFQQELRAEEYEPIRYGLNTPLKNQGPVTVIFQEWMNIAKDVRRNGLSWKQRWNYVFGRPGWAPEGNKSSNAAIFRPDSRARNRRSGKMMHS